jgi:hypothetical protein
LKDQLYKSLDLYINYAAANLKHPPASFKIEEKEKLSVSHIDPAYQLRHISEKTENSLEFNNLVSIFSTALGRKTKRPPSDPNRQERNALKNFLRRSRTYLNMHQGKSIDIDECFERLMTAFAERNIKATSLRLIEEVYFSEDLIDFGAFKIQRYSKKNLDDLFENQINHIFYPYAESNTQKLCWYWFLQQERSENSPQGDISQITINFNWSNLFRVSMTLPDRAIQLLTLFDWESKFFARPNDIKSDSGWLSFSPPISFSVTDDIFASPYPTPNIADLEFFPQGNPYGEEDEEAPPFYIDLDEEELKRFKTIIGNALELLENLDLKACNWDFIDRAMGYLAKAFFTEGLEQLLWHMIVLETLFGEKDEILESLRSRISSILAKTQAEKKSIRKTINELYDFRSDLVHGNPINKTVYKGHLRQARQLARDSMLWFLTYLSSVKPELLGKGVPLDNYPHRKELLTLLDLKKEGLGRLGLLIEKLPNHFPNIDIWGQEHK